MSRGSTESSNSHEEALGGVSSFSAAPPNALDVPDKCKSLSLSSPASLERLSRDESDTLTLSAVAAVTNEAVDEVKQRLSLEEATPKEEVETATLPALVAVSNNGADAAPLEEELEAEDTAETTLPKTALWTAISVENKEAVTTQKEAIHTLNTRVWSAIPKEGVKEQATAHQTPVEEVLHTAVWPAASRSTPPLPAPTALHPVSSTQSVGLTISRSRAILLTLLISFLNILLGVFIVLALLYQLNGSLIYQSPAPVQEIRAKVTQLERQASQLAGEIELLEERTEQLEAAQETFEDASDQIERLQGEENNVQKELKQAQEEIATLQEENRQLQRELTNFETVLTGLQELLEEMRLYESKPLR